MNTTKRYSLELRERAVRMALERENRELKRAREILCKTSAYLAQAEIDRRRT